MPSAAAKLAESSIASNAMQTVVGYVTPSRKQHRNKASFRGPCGTTVMLLQGVGLSSSFASVNFRAAQNNCRYLKGCER